MCIAIYALLFALALFYSDSILEQYALAVSGGENQWLTVALGWEMVLTLWPVFLLAMVAASALTFFISRSIFSNNKPN